MLYITFVDFLSFYGIGLKKKIRGQIDAMEGGTEKIYYTGYSYPIVCLMNGQEVIEKEVAATKRDQILVLCDWIKKYRVTQTYIRYAHLDQWFMNLLIYQKKQCIKTVLEIASYPYDGELQEGIIKKEDILYRDEMYKYVDRIVTYSNDEKIWNIPCIRLKNGISTQDVFSVEKKKKKTN